MKKLKNALINENIILVLCLGLCSSLAVTTKVESAYTMGICVMIVLIFSNIIVSLIRKIVPDTVQLPVYILISGTIVTVLEILLKTYIKPLYDVLGIYLPLIVVNCIVLGRAISVASVSPIKKSFQDALITGLGYTFALILIALIREVLGSNTITLMDNLSVITGYKAIYKFPANQIFPISLLQQPAGAFLTIGLLMGIFNYRRNKHESI